jgi:hypothetical protein
LRIRVAAASLSKESVLFISRIVQAHDLSARKWVDRATQTYPS